jgi:hypothetical protein
MVESIIGVVAQILMLDHFIKHNLDLSLRGSVSLAEIELKLLSVLKLVVFHVA